MAQFADREDFERYIFFESQREAAEREHKSNKNDATALLKWGSALIELAHFQQGQRSLDQLDEAVGKLQAAIKLDERLHEAHWGLGNAYTSQGLLQADQRKAEDYFRLAKAVFAKALELDPGNRAYARAMDMIEKAPEIYQELQQQLQLQQAGGRGGAEAGPSSSRGDGAKESKSGISEMWYDIGGWVMLAGIVAYLAVAQSKALPPPTA